MTFNWIAWHGMPYSMTRCQVGGFRLHPNMQPSPALPIPPSSMGHPDMLRICHVGPGARLVLVGILWIYNLYIGTCILWIYNLYMIYIYMRYIYYYIWYMDENMVPHGSPWFPRSLIHWKSHFHAVRSSEDASASTKAGLWWSAAGLFQEDFVIFCDWRKFA